MKFGIIAAGEGSRLLNEGIHIPKPLVPINGTTMLRRLINVFTNCGADEIFVIINGTSGFTSNYLHELKNTVSVPLRIIEKTTESSLHSFYEIVRTINDDKFCVTTVDTIFKEEEFYCMINSFIRGCEDGVMGVTSYVDDEKPLFISTDKNMYINGFLDSSIDNTEFVSGGIYCLTRKSLPTLERCIGGGVSRMRNFQRYLVEDGLRLKAYSFTKILDVDHAGDIEKAELFLKGEYTDD